MFSGLPVRRIQPVDPAAVAVIRALVGLGLEVLVVYGDDACRAREERLIAAGVRGLLRAVVYTDPRDVTAPGHKFFTTVARAGGYDPDQVCYVGDRAVSFIGPALRQGMRAVLVAPPGPVPEVPAGVAVIGHVRELPALLARTIGNAR